MGLSNLEVDVDDDGTLWAELQELEGVAFSIGVADVRICFHRLIMPAWMSRYVGFPSLTAAEAGLTGEEVDGATMESHEMVRPMARALPM